MSVYLKKITNASDAAEIAYSITKKMLPDVSYQNKIIIKANICAPIKPEKGVTTHHEIVIGVLEALKKCKHITIVESDTTSTDFKDNITAWDTTFVKKYPNTRVVNLSTLPQVKKRVEGIRHVYDLEFADILSDYDILINLPVMKTHILTGVSLGMKNLFGLISIKNKSQFHIDIHDIVFGMTRSFYPDLTILDGIEGMEGMGPIFGQPANAKIILASRNVVQLDAVATTYMGVDPNSIHYLRNALRYFEKGKTISDFQVTGIGIGEPTPFHVPLTLAKQILTSLVSSEKKSLEYIKNHLNAPDQTKRNLHAYMKVLETRNIVTTLDNQYQITPKGMNEFIELYPECADIRRIMN